MDLSRGDNRQKHLGCSIQCRLPSVAIGSEPEILRECRGYRQSNECEPDRLAHDATPDRELRCKHIPFLQIGSRWLSSHSCSTLESKSEYPLTNHRPTLSEMNLASDRITPQPIVNCDYANHILFLQSHSIFRPVRLHPAEWLACTVGNRCSDSLDRAEDCRGYRCR